MSLGTGYTELFQKRVKSFPVFRKVYAVGRRAENTYALLIEVTAKLDSRLPAESNNNAVRLFDVYYILYVFGSKRFEIEPVRGIEIG